MRYRIPEKFEQGAVKAYVQTYVVCDNCVLLLKKKQSDKFFSNEWVGIGGKIENEELPKKAALRELKEETGQEIFQKIKLCGIYSWTESSKTESKKGGINYIFISKITKKIEINNKEEGEFKWFTFEDAIKLEDLVPHLRFYLNKILNNPKSFYTGIAEYFDDKLVWYSESN